jgi:ATP-dependent exoDNAse (exonuclease V) beta subunit
MVVDGRPEYQFFGWTTPGYVSGEWLQARKTQAEMVRLLYVATTRAKQRLVVSGGWPRPGKVVPPEAAANFAALIGRRLDTEAVSAQVAAGSEREIDAETRVQRVLPAFAEAPDETDDEADAKKGWFPSEQQMRAIGELTGARTSAVERMEQPVIRSASAEAHDRLRRADGEEQGSALAEAGSRDLAMAVGTAVHGLLETLDLGSELAGQVEESRDRLVAEVLRAAGEDQASDAEKTIDAVLARIVAGPCLERLSALAPSVVARELPVFGWEEPGDGPGVVISGIVDLVYRDPDDGRVVVADYKTDALDNEDAIEQRARVYQPQVAAYARILRDALDLDEEPHTELWFLAADRIVRL